MYRAHNLAALSAAAPNPSPFEGPPLVDFGPSGFLCRVMLLLCLNLVATARGRRHVLNELQKCTKKQQTEAMSCADCQTDGRMDEGTTGNCVALAASKSKFYQAKSERGWVKEGGGGGVLRVQVWVRVRVRVASSGKIVTVARFK